MKLGKLIFLTMVAVVVLQVAAFAAPAVKQNLREPETVRATCEHLGTAWLVLTSACVIVAFVRRYGVLKTLLAPKCAIGSVIGGLVVGLGFLVANEWVTAIGGIIIIASHVCECTSHAWEQMIAGDKEDEIDVRIMRKTEEETDFSNDSVVAEGVDSLSNS